MQNTPSPAALAHEAAGIALLGHVADRKRREQETRDDERSGRDCARRQTGEVTPNEICADPVQRRSEGSGQSRLPDAGARRLPAREDNDADEARDESDDAARGDALAVE